MKDLGSSSHARRNITKKSHEAGHARVRGKNDENEPPPNTNENTQNEEIEPEIENEILEILGKDPSTEQAKEHPIHSQLVARWNGWITEGLPKEEKTEVLSKFSRKGSCKLEEPGLNPEVAASMNESAIKRDKHFLTLQNTLGSAIAALGAGTTRIIMQKEGLNERIKILEYLSDAGKILTDFHHSLTLARKSFISPGLPKEIRDVLENVKTDTLLYGEKLSERIKESQSIEKIGQNIRPQESTKKPSIRSTIALTLCGRRRSTGVRRCGRQVLEPAVKKIFTSHICVLQIKALFK
ncbi:hypothetical protein KPH14_012787 [Odynerus spinipes]|uniref:Uncharacterized protein n=1 Tax=Odynerus spinipes TaxID=1348599 RepID=A0AAD9VJZ9_9HYME|nr:hypothetical protein KPH14_012787 [Odynerus spinipes]